ncbi:hypothetical protein [Methylomonas rivi]|uniref:Nucleoplasmin-like domain-containing protein n=1 Tax=Methylomonas rivi TaxID=2952226 RepID=A0ABT1U9C1_9GAMM|nr:hypothetical protein [Methylomonas sp. WSC-6]MBS4051068.1 hypothetical protein [Methylomonas sp.]MCQ8130456.1 hypothetical protein [Methylomonas sp. WSC-6]
MDEKSRQASTSSLSNSAVLSFQDLLHIGRCDAAGDYFSLSITRQDQSICIQLTTADAQPVTYKAIISGHDSIDIGSLLFVAQ